MRPEVRPIADCNALRRFFLALAGGHPAQPIPRELFLLARAASRAAGQPPGGDSDVLGEFLLRTCGRDPADARQRCRELAELSGADLRKVLWYRLWQVGIHNLPARSLTRRLMHHVQLALDAPCAGAADLRLPVSLTERDRLVGAHVRQAVHALCARGTPREVNALVRELRRRYFDAPPAGHATRQQPDRLPAVNTAADLRVAQRQLRRRLREALGEPALALFAARVAGDSLEKLAVTHKVSITTAHMRLRKVCATVRRLARDLEFDRDTLLAALEAA